MSELRDKIAYMASEYGSPESEILTDDFVSAILSLIDSSPVEELEVVRRCDNCDDGTVYRKTGPLGHAGYPCEHCHGTGEIVRPLTRGELETWARKMLKTHYTLPSSQDWVILLPSGDRIRVKP